MIRRRFLHRHLPSTTSHQICSAPTPHAGAVTDAVTAELMSTKAAGGDLQALRAKHATDRSKRNLGTVTSWPVRWARMLDVIERVAPDIITLQELDHTKEAQEELRALGFECSLNASTLCAGPHSAPSQGNRHDEVYVPYKVGF